MKGKENRINLEDKKSSYNKHTRKQEEHKEDKN